jgi:hypothetical protein
MNVKLKEMSEEIQSGQAEMRSTVSVIKEKPIHSIRSELEDLEEYDFISEHRQGRKHNNADVLSRRPCQKCVRTATKLKHGQTSYRSRLRSGDSEGGAIKRPRHRTQSIGGRNRAATGMERHR